MDAFERAPHYLLDARLMMAWAKALDERGETDKARYVAAAPEGVPQRAGGGVLRARCRRRRTGRRRRAPPFQCQAPTRAFRFEDFR